MLQKFIKVSSTQWVPIDKYVSQKQVKKTSSQVYIPIYVYTVYKYQRHWELTPFTFLRGAAFAGGSLSQGELGCSTS